MPGLAQRELEVYLHALRIPALGGDGQH